MKIRRPVAYLLSLPVAVGLVWLMVPAEQAASHRVHGAPLDRSMPTTPSPTVMDALANEAEGAIQALRQSSPPVENHAEAPTTGSRHPAVQLPYPDASEQAAFSTAARNREWAWQVSDHLERWRYGDLGDQDLRGKDFSNADLGFVDLAHADLAGAKLDGADLRYASLQEANLEDVTMKKSYLASADLRESVLRGARMGPVNLIGADLRGADLRDVQFACPDCSTWSTVFFANLEGADLRGADFGRSMIHDSVFEKADLRGANLADARGVPRSLRGAVYNRDTRLPERPVKIDPEEWEMIYAP